MKRYINYAIRIVLIFCMVFALLGCHKEKTAEKNQPISDNSSDRYNHDDTIYHKDIIELKKNDIFDITVGVDSEYKDDLVNAELYNRESQKTFNIFQSKKLFEPLTTSVTITETGSYYLFIYSENKAIEKDALNVTYTIRKEVESENDDIIPLSLT